MFRKLKDKLAEEVKSSPQRIQQFAQAAQAAVTSASSSISDITNNDLFSIGDNDNQHGRSAVTSSQQSSFQDVSLTQSNVETQNLNRDYLQENPRQRRLSNSSFASDVSFRLPSYETPSMYHLQSDMEVSASEAEERGFPGGPATLDRVTKEQLYAAYKRTQERYTKYRTQYGDLARHYKLLERENAKARSVLVETQDKALRRISELREQCGLEQSAKAHLEKALRVDIDEKNIKIETLNTQIKLLQSDSKTVHNDNEVHLINLSNDNETPNTEVTALNNKIEKMEQLLNKYKESLKTSKEKNSQITTEFQLLSTELEQKRKQIEQSEKSVSQLDEANKKIQELNNTNEDLQNKLNTYDFSKTKEFSTLETDLLRAQEDIAQMQKKIEVFTKREEENAISLAENKLSIHKELESKEAEIKSLKDSLNASKKEVDSLNIVISDYKSKLSSLEDDQIKLKNECAELMSTKNKIGSLESQLQEITKRCQTLEQFKVKADEEQKCQILQMKQESAEKMAIIDRNTYLENKNTQLTEENTKRCFQISHLESELQTCKINKENDNSSSIESEKNQLRDELHSWKEKCHKLEMEIQEEKDELTKLQTEIERLLAHHELIQAQNQEFHTNIATLTVDNDMLQEKVLKYDKIIVSCKKLATEVKEVQKCVSLTTEETKSFTRLNKEMLSIFVRDIQLFIQDFLQKEIESVTSKYNILQIEHATVQNELKNNNELSLTQSRQINLVQNENSSLKSTLLELNAEKNNLTDKLKVIESQRDSQINEMNNKIIELSAHNEESKQQYQNFMALAENEKQKTIELVNNLEVKNQILIKELDDIRKDGEFIQDENSKNNLIVEKLNTEKQILLQKLEEIEKNSNQNSTLVDQIAIEKQYVLDQLSLAQNKCQEYEAQQLIIQEKVESLGEQNKELIDQVTSFENINESLKKELKLLKLEREDMNLTLETINNENEHLKSKSVAFDKNLFIIKELEQNNKLVSAENITLKQQAEQISSNVMKLESEIQDVRESHSEMEKEKNRLNKAIEELENNELKRKTALIENNKHTQTDDSVDVIIKQEIIDVNAAIDNKVEQYEHINSQKYDDLQAAYNLLKEDNRRLRSDIEGLQTYLTNISKENSSLNDKLREMIASEQFSDNNDNPNKVCDLTNEIKLIKDENNDLSRENSLLIEENLELKDQLQSHNYPKESVNTTQGNNKEVVMLKDKYNILLQSNQTLEQKNIELVQMNRSVNCNMQQVQDKNEKLKLSNEKLERRLDESLVSLRHLHSLQENTELEYLRNILYEYLTGSGTHALTLAKVLAAIVKFDDSQTQAILQKEKERQGLLRQLGII